MCNPLFCCSRCHLPCPLHLRPYTARSMHLCTSTVGQNCDVGMFFLWILLVCFCGFELWSVTWGRCSQCDSLISQFLLTYLCTFSNLGSNLLELRQQFLRIFPITCFYISNDIRFQVKNYGEVYAYLSSKLISFHTMFHSNATMWLFRTKQVRIPFS
jgi:hypothetical protein